MGINNKYFIIHIENCLNTYWKVRKYFVKPNIKFYIGKKRNKPFIPNCKILNIFISDVKYKQTAKKIYFKHNPIIDIILFNRWEIKIELARIGCFLGWTPYHHMEKCISDESKIYWKTILTWLLKPYTLKKCLEINTKKRNIKYGDLSFIQISPTKNICLKSNLNLGEKYNNK